MAKKIQSSEETVDAYLAPLPKEVRGMLEKVRQAIKRAAPKAEERIWYHIPSYLYNGPLIHFAAFKDHCSLIGVSKDLIKIYSKELEPFKTTGTTIHFTPDNPIPLALVKKMVKTRVKSNEVRTKKKMTVQKALEKKRVGSRTKSTASKNTIRKKTNKKK